MSKLQDLIANDLSVIKNALVVQEYNLDTTKDGTALVDITTPPPFNSDKSVVYKQLTNVPMLLKSLSLTYDSTFLADYQVFTELQGLNIDDNEFINAPGGSSGFDYVPPGASFLIPAGATLKIWAFNQGGASSSGSLNVLAVFDKLDTYNI